MYLNKFFTSFKVPKKYYLKSIHIRCKKSEYGEIYLHTIRELNKFISTRCSYGVLFIVLLISRSLYLKILPREFHNLNIRKINLRKAVFFNPYIRQINYEWMMILFQVRRHCWTNLKKSLKAVFQIQLQDITTN